MRSKFQSHSPYANVHFLPVTPTCTYMGAALDILLYSACNLREFITVIFIMTIDRSCESHTDLATSHNHTGSPQTFTVDVTPSANYPLDIYILMDLSTSMQFYLDNLQDVTGSLGMSVHKQRNVHKKNT